MRKTKNQNFLTHCADGGAWMAELARSVATIYTIGLILSLTGAASYFSTKIAKGKIFFNVLETCFSFLIHCWPIRARECDMSQKITKK